jgi:tetratricopeptide (TPR) repeat protein
MGTIWGLGHAALFARDYALADSAYGVALDHASLENRGWGLFTLSRSLRHQGRFRETIEQMTDDIAVIRKELGDSHQLGAAYWGRSIIYSDWIKDHQKALEDLDSMERVVRAQPKDPTYEGGLQTVRMGRIYAYALMGEFETADALLAQVDTSDIENYFFWLGILEMARGNHETAVQCLERDQRKGSLGGLNDLMWLGMAYLKNGQAHEAIEALEESAFRYDDKKVAFVGQSAWTHCLLAQAYDAAGRRSEAIDQYEVFLEIWKHADPGLEPVEDARRRLAELKGESG